MIKIFNWTAALKTLTHPNIRQNKKLNYGTAETTHVVPDKPYVAKKTRLSRLHFCPDSMGLASVHLTVDSESCLPYCTKYHKMTATGPFKVTRGHCFQVIRAYWFKSLLLIGGASMSTELCHLVWTPNSVESGLQNLTSKNYKCDSIMWSTKYFNILNHFEVDHQCNRSTNRLTELRQQ